MRVPFKRAGRLARAASFAMLALGLGVGSAQAQCGNGVVDDGGAPCVGDCNESGDVTVDEIVTMVNLALTGGVTGCAAADSNSDGSVTVDEIITAVNNALTGCPASGGQATEECDDGGICIGDATAGQACTSDADCGEGADGVCLAGAKAFNGCSSDADCPGSTCVRCKTFGGDGCAANCTNETTIDFPLKTGKLPSSGPLTGGKCVGGDKAGSACTNDSGCQGAINGFCLEGSTAAVFGPFIQLPLDLSGSTKLIVGKAGDDGVIPVAMPAADVNLPRIPVSSIACACVRGAAASTCGGVTFYKDGSQATNCTPNFNGQEECPTDLPCAAVHGPGNTASGFIGCEGLEPGSVNFELDCNGNPGEDPFDPIITLSGTGAPGSAFMVLSAAIGTVVGACTGTSPDYGADGAFCTGDDPLANRGSPNTVPFVTGSATGIATNVADFEGDNVGPHTTFGQGFTCNPDGTLGSISGVNLSGVFASCDQPTISDIVVPINFIGQ